MKSFVAAAAVAFTAFAAASAMAMPVSFDFTGSFANLGASSTFNSVPGGLSVEAFAINTESPPVPELIQTSFGLGVLTPETCVFIFCTDTGGDTLIGNDGFELDNVGDDEAIVFRFSEKVKAGNVTVTFATLVDEVQIWGSNTDVTGLTSGGLSSLLAGATNLLDVDTDAGIAADSFALADAGHFEFLIATNPGGSGSGYYVQSLSNVQAIPLPAAAWLLLAAAGGLVVAKRRATGST